MKTTITLAAIIILLKLAGILHSSWWLITAPIWFPLAVLFAVTAFIWLSVAIRDIWN